MPICQKNNLNKLHFVNFFISQTEISLKHKFTVYLLGQFQFSKGLNKVIIAWLTVILLVQSHTTRHYLSHAVQVTSPRVSLVCLFKRPEDMQRRN